MANTFNKLGIIFLSLAALSSCGEEENSAITTGGRMTGSVQVWNDKTSSLSDKSGVMVTINNLSGKSTVTAADGSYSFDNVPLDTYDLTFAKAGYGMYKLLGIPHTSATATTPTIIPAVQFGALSTTTITALAFDKSTYNGVPGVSYIYSVNPTPSASNRGYVRAFLGPANAVSNTNYTAYSSLRSLSNNNVTGGFTADELYALGFNSGQTVFLKLYGDSLQSNDYKDPITGKQVFPNLNATSPATISFVVP